MSSEDLKVALQIINMIATFGVGIYPTALTSVLPMRQVHRSRSLPAR